MSLKALPGETFPQVSCGSHTCTPVFMGLRNCSKGIFTVPTERGCGVRLSPRVKAVTGNGDALILLTPEV